MPITTPTSFVERYGGDRDHFLHVLDHLFAPAVEKAGHELIRPISEGADLIHAEIVRNLEQADLVLCDISTLNANVFFELGIRTALNRATCLVRDEHTELPFDTGGLNFHTYRPGLNAWHFEDDIANLARHIETTVARSKGKNALWQQFGLSQIGVGAEEASSGTDKLDLVLSQVQALERRLESRPVETQFSEPLMEALGNQLADFGIQSFGYRLADDGVIELHVFDRGLDPTQSLLLRRLARRHGHRLIVGNDAG